MGHLPRASPSDIDRRVRDAVTRGRAERIRGDRTTADVGTVLLALLMQPLFVSVVPATVRLGWLGVFAAVTVGRALARRRFAGPGALPERALAFIRWEVWLGGTLWSAWAFLLMGAPPTQLAYLMAIVAALIASSTNSLVADSRAFYGYLVLMDLPLLAAVLDSGRDAEHLSLAGLIVLYSPLMISLHRKAQSNFLGALEANARLTVSEEDAARGRDFLDSLIRSTPHGIVVQDREQRVLGVNPEWERMFGFKVDEVRGLWLRDLITPVATAGTLASFNAELEAGGRAAVEAPFMRKDGSPFWVHAVGTAASGIAEGATILAMEDITVRRAAEEALMHAERQYREMVESSTDLVWAMDERGVITYANGASTEMLGRAPDDLLGMHFSEILDPDQVERGGRRLSEVMGGMIVADQEYALLRADGTRCEVSVSARPRVVAGGVVVGVHGTARDISARVKEREALEEAREVAEAMARAKAAFLANMSHEIRTPMNGVLGMLDLLLSTDLDDGQRESGELARASALGLLTIVDDVLDMSKIEAGQFDLRQEDFTVSDLVESTVGIFALQAANRGNTVSAEIALDVPARLHGDAGRLRQVLSNLLSNAVKFTEDGHVQTTVQVVGVEGHAGMVRFSVRDSGVGIPEDKLDHVFEEFAQLDPSMSRAHGGTGLGLTIARRLVQLMGGKLHAESRLGEGSRFWFDVPLPPAAPAADASPPPTEPSAPRRPIRILLAEDNPVNQLVAQAILERRGHSVHVVANGLLAVEAVKTGAFELVLMDVRMPEMDGLEATRSIRALPEHGTLPIVALTAHALAEERQRCFDAGMDDFLSKPFIPDELFAVIEGLVGGEPRKGDAR